MRSSSCAAILRAPRDAVFVGEGHVRGVIAVNNARELKLARKWMNQGRAVDTEALADTSRTLA